MTTREKVLYPYKVRVNWNDEVHEFYTHAPTAGQAKRNGVHKLAYKLGMTVAFVASVAKEVTAIQLTGE